MHGYSISTAKSGAAYRYVQYPPPSANSRHDNDNTERRTTGRKRPLRRTCCGDKARPAYLVLPFFSFFDLSSPILFVSDVFFILPSSLARDSPTIAAYLFRSTISPGYAMHTLFSPLCFLFISPSFCFLPVV